MATRTYRRRIAQHLQERFYQVAASGLLPGRWFRPSCPDIDQRRTAGDILQLEVVSHCWQYAPMLLYQLSSLVLHPPTRLKLTMTVYYAAADRATARVLAFIDSHNVPNICWNWRVIEPERLFRRSIGRDHAAKTTQADWIWMTDCDIIFHAGCWDSLAQELAKRRDALLFPQTEQRTAMLGTTDSLLATATALLGGDGPLQLLDIDQAQFSPYTLSCAKGEYQIVHGDVARAIGYCDGLAPYQTPATHWCKCREDRVFRWLVGSAGVPIDIESVYQIRHIHKGRYRRGSRWSRIRSAIRRWQTR